MQKDWKLKDKLKNSDFQKYSDINPLILQILFNRGINTKKEINDFLDEIGETHDPFLFKEMDRAVELIVNHIKKGNKITVYGDYDADGVTSSAVLFNVLNLFQAEVGVYIPHRVYEGYGLNEKAVKSLSESGTKLIITVDGGIRGKKEVQVAKDLGMDIIITDHHIPPESQDDYPDCIIIDPIIKSETYPFKYLAGVGVAFKLASAIISKSKLNNNDKQKLIEQQLDLVAIGTIADCVKLRGENRSLTKKGLKELDKAKKIGIKELAKISGFKEKNKFDSWNIGFQIAPRLNAVGRLDHAETAFKLLVEKDQKKAKKIVLELNERNTQRQGYTLELFEYVDSSLENPKNSSILIGVCPSSRESKNNWNEGVIGLVAGRLSSKYYRPALVLTETEDGFKGSGRSITEFNLIEAIEKCAPFLDKYGGHPMACGLSLQKKNLKKFTEEITKISDQKINIKTFNPKIIIDQEINLEELDLDLIKDLEKLKPFGQENEKPIFMSKKLLVLDFMTMGAENQHIKLRIKSENSKVISALAFSQAEKWQDIKIGDTINMAYYAEINNFNGRSEVQLKIIDIKSF
jgi:single-stranded-DNA-specific exonuclease